MRENFGTAYGAAAATVGFFQPLVAARVTSVFIGVGLLSALFVAALVLRELFSGNKNQTESRMKTTKKPFTLQTFGVTHIGGRANNEDAFLVKEDTFVVADGMGGQACGEDASAALIGAFADSDLSRSDWFTSAVALAHQRMNELVAQDPRRNGFGTTVVAVRKVSEDGLEIGSAGDSHFFLLRGGKLERLTEEHSIAAALCRAGQIAESEIATHRMRNVLYNFVGATANVPNCDLRSLTIEEGDRYLVCSDGLTDYSDLSEVQRILAGTGTVEERAQALIDLAVANQTKDNATAIVIDVAR